MNPIFKNLGREDLKKFFRNGRLPSEKDFAQLIDSGINKLDDGFVKDDEHGLVLASTGGSKKIISFFRGTEEAEPFMILERSVENIEALRLTPLTDRSDAETNTNSNSFFFHTNGSLGIGATADEKYKLQINNGFTGLYARAGTYATGKVPANGKWHPVIKELDNCQAFEIVARTGVKRTGKFAMMHAVAVSAFGGKARNKVRKVSAHYGFFWNKLNVKWGGQLHDYALLLRSNSNYGDGVYIYYHVTKLWDDATFLPTEYYY
jgi:hypothetical protein